MKSQATLKVLLDKRKGIPKKNEKYGVKVRVTHERSSRFFPCYCDLTDEQFEKVMYSDKLSRKEREVYDQIMFYRAKVDAIITDMQEFSWDTLKNIFYEKTLESDTILANPVYQLFDKLIQENISSDRVGNAKFMKCAKASLMEHRPKLKFEDITRSFLEDYERWFIAKKKSITTVGIYMRELRTVYNLAASPEYKLVPRDLYPFHNKDNPKGYIIPIGKNVKKALSKEQIQQVVDYPFKEFSKEDKARDFWYFTYLNNGINHKDICNLKYKDIVKKEIFFNRAKTIRSSRGKDKTIISSLLNESERIIEKWGNKDKDPDNYVFPILTPGLTAQRVQEVAYTHLQSINKFNNRLAKTLKLGMKLTTMVARHSFASVMIENNVDLAIIKELMGHSSITTTEKYVKPFNSKSRRTTAELLRVGR